MMLPRIGVVNTNGFVTSPATWSGTPAFFVEALEDHANVVAMSPPRRRFTRTLDGLRRLAGLVGYEWRWESEPLILKLLGDDVDIQAKQHRVDAVILTGRAVTLPTERDYKAYYWGDAAHSQRVDRAPFWTGVSSRSLRLAEEAEAQAVAMLDGVWMPSEWAASKVRRDSTARGIQEPKVDVVPFGANIKVPSQIVRSEPQEKVKLLLVGVEWERKGVSTAIDATRFMRDSGVNAELTVVGCMPPTTHWERPYVNYIGRLDKSTPEGQSALDTVYREHDIFILPSKADPSPIVVAEAQAYGLPVVASTVDGIPEKLCSNACELVDLSQGPEGFAAAAEKCVHDNYSNRSVQAREFFERELSWQSAARRVIQAIT